jgi:hypothetical protein
MKVLEELHYWYSYKQHRISVTMKSKPIIVLPDGKLATEATNDHIAPTGFDDVEYRGKWRNNLVRYTSSVNTLPVDKVGRDLEFDTCLTGPDRSTA